MDALVINDADNVAIALKNLMKGEKVLLSNGDEIVALEDISYTHKIAMTEIEEGEAVIKYGVAIASAGESIKQGMWVHIHNLKGDAD